MPLETGKQPFTVESSPIYDSANDETTIPVEETISITSGGELKVDVALTPSAKEIHFAGGKMYYGNVQWPTRYPDVAYTEENTRFDVRLQNEYSAADIQLHGPYKELTDVGKVACAWHLETALNVYVKDKNENNPSWYHYRRLTPTEQGLYAVKGKDFLSNYVFNAERFDSQSNITEKEVPPGSGIIDESQAVVASHVNRPLEVTSNGFALQTDEEVRALMNARLAEEEGLREYDFYIGTEESIYVGNPRSEDVSVSTTVVTRSFGISMSAFEYPAYTLLPQATAIVSTEGIIRILQGRQEQRLFPEGAVPWGVVYDIEYHIDLNELAIATDEGVWFYDWDRQGIFRQYDSFNALALAYDRANSTLLGWDDDSTVWKRFNESGAELEPSITTQEIESGGREIEIVWIKADYDISGYDNTDKSTFAELWHSTRDGRTLDYTQNPTSITGDVTVNADRAAGSTSINVMVSAGGSVNLVEEDYILFKNHGEAYRIDADVSISGGSTGTLTISKGLVQPVPSGTNVRLPYRGIFKLPQQERVRPFFRDSGHQIRVRNFDTLRGIQFRADPQISYE